MAKIHLSRFSSSLKQNLDFNNTNYRSYQTTNTILSGISHAMTIIKHHVSTMSITQETVN